MTIRPAGWPPMVMSKKTLGLEAIGAEIRSFFSEENKKFRVSKREMDFRVLGIEEFI